MVRERKTLQLSLPQLESQETFVSLMEKEALQAGDKVEVRMEENEMNLWLLFILALIAAALGQYFEKDKKEKRIADGSRILDDLFAGRDAAALEKEIEAHYGIEIEFLKESGGEQAHWNALAMQNLATAYGEEEPDYDHLLQDSNPDFKPNPNYRP